MRRPRPRGWSRRSAPDSEISVGIEEEDHARVRSGTKQSVAHRRRVRVSPAARGPTESLGSRKTRTCHRRRPRYYLGGFGLGLEVAKMVADDAGDSEKG